MQRPLALDDSQLDAIMRAAAPLQPQDRDAFLKDVAHALNGHELGDGIVGRICAEVQRKYWRAPEIEMRGGTGVGKWAR
jgi:hypothetical protein